MKEKTKSKEDLRAFHANNVPKKSGTNTNCKQILWWESKKHCPHLQEFFDGEGNPIIDDFSCEDSVSCPHDIEDCPYGHQVIE